jgi:hypothetical protein
MFNEKVLYDQTAEPTGVQGLPENIGPELAEDFVERPLEEPKERIEYLTEIEECEPHIGGVE